MPNGEVWNDLVPLCSAMLNTFDSSTCTSSATSPWCSRIPSPNLFRKGLTSSQGCFRVFKMKLQQRLWNKPEQTSQQWRHILSAIGSIEEIAGLRWENEADWEDWAEDPKVKQDSSGGKTNALNLAKGFHQDMTNFLQLSRVRYRDLVAAHVIIVCSGRHLNFRRTLESDFNSEIKESVPTPRKLDVMEVSKIEAYFDELAELVTWVRERHLSAYCLTDEEIQDAWFSMMFRAFCWHRGHVMIEGVAPLPSEYWNSKMPVYIG